MKLKTLLLGSAASLMAVTGAQAADAVVEDEAVEYVRVCETFGTGYFFIPGTETCLRFNGDIRVQYVINDEDGPVASDALDTVHQWRYRARLGVSSATESDLGTITTFTRFEAGASNFQVDDDTGVRIAGLSITDPIRVPVRVDQAIIGIGGLSVGFGDNYWSRNIGFGLVGAAVDGLYGYGQELYVEYTYEVAGFAVTAGVAQFEPDDAQNGGPGTGIYAENPNLYAGVNYGASFGSIGATVYYTNESGFAGADNGFDFALGAQFRPLEGLNVEAFVLGGDGAYTRNAGGAGADYAYGIGAGYTFGDVTPYVLYTATDGANDDYISVGAYWQPSGTGLTFLAEASFETDDGDADSVLDGEDNTYTFRLVKSF